ncbi:MAG: D-glycero-alpha-D-manno-heptose-1,7-bisphosphate 7-phosphatase [Oligosphaeraceae bacterium]
MTPPLSCLKLLTPVFPRQEARPAFFLDRDDTLIPDVPYLREPEGVRLFPRSAPALRLLRQAGYRLILVSNQSGVGRGLIRPDQLWAVHRRLQELLQAEGVQLDGAYFCPHAPEERCPCRKPSPGMLQAALEDFPTLKEESALAGDRSADILLAKAGGLAAIQIHREGADPLPQADAQAQDLWEAAQWLLVRRRPRGEGRP